MATNIKILDEVMDDKELLEDLILSAINDAVRQISDASSAKMKTATGGMNLPSGTKTHQSKYRRNYFSNQCHSRGGSNRSLY